MNKPRSWLDPLLVIEDDSGTEFPRRRVVQFTGATVTDDPTGDRTVVATVANAGAVVTDASSGGGEIDDVPTANVSRLRYTDATPPFITGFADGVDGKRITVISTTGDLDIECNHVGSAVGNRVTSGGTSIAVPAGSGVTLEYDGADAVWRRIL